MTASDKPRVWVDGLVFENDSQLGIWRLFYEVMRRTAGRVDYTLGLRGRVRRPVPPGVRVWQDSGRRVVARWDVVGHLRRGLSRARTPAGMRRADVFHSTYFTRPGCPGPAEVVTVYDMVVERLFGICGDWAAPSIAIKRAALGATRHRVAISAATAADLAAFYPHDPPARVIHPGAEHLGGPVPGRETGPGEYVLFVGARACYKNFSLVLDAMSHPAWPPGLPLRVVGSPFESHELDYLRAVGLADRVHHLGRVGDEELRAAYARAACLVFPSLLEGFGFPTLEAQAGGCPVVVSDLPVSREVARDAGLFFDPRLGERLAEAVAEVVRPTVRTRLVEAGYANVRRFSWDEAAERTVAVYREAADSRRDAVGCRP